MKKTIGLILVFILVCAVAANAFAAGKPKITKQPETATTNKKGTVSFSIKTSGTVKSIIWHFIDPETGNDYTGKKLSGAVKGVKVSSPNGKTITLKKVPESMHGWTVYAHINGNGYKVDSDRVMLLVYGLEPPETAASDSAETSAGENEGEDSEASAEEPKEESGTDEGTEPTEAADTTVTAETAETSEAAGAAEGVQEEESETDSNTPQTVIVTANAKILHKLDDPDNAYNSLEFNGTASFLVSSEDPISSWSVNGIRFEPAQPVNQFTVTNVTSSISLDVKISRGSAADAVVDESHMCRVTCTGCKFTYVRSGLRSVAEGDVPAGARISVFADDSEYSKGGYSINGAESENAGKASFQLAINEDTTIVCRK